MILKTIGLLTLLAFTFTSGFIIGRLNIPTPINAIIDAVTDAVQENGASTTIRASTTSTQTPHASTSTSTNVPATITVANKLTEGQKNMLMSFGLDPNTIVLTPTIIACAEGKVGKTRLDEITKGATPTFFEGASLLVCYK